MNAALRTSAVTTKAEPSSQYGQLGLTIMTTPEPGGHEKSVKSRFDWPNAVGYINAPNRDHGVEQSIRKFISAFCETHQFFLYNVYNDTGYDNKTMVLPSFWSMCYALPKFKIAAVVIFDRDHLSPDRAIAQKLAEEIQEMGVKIYVINQGATPSEAR